MSHTILNFIIVPEIIWTHFVILNLVSEIRIHFGHARAIECNGDQVRNDIKMPKSVIIGSRSLSTSGILQKVAQLISNDGKGISIKLHMRNVGEVLEILI